VELEEIFLVEVLVAVAVVLQLLAKIQEQAVETVVKGLL
jgi:hypothetical protein